MIDKERRPDETVGRTDCTGQHVHTAYPLPVFINSLHLRQSRIICEYLQITTFVKIKFAVAVLHYKCLAAAVGKRPMQKRHRAAVESLAVYGKIV